MQLRSLLIIALAGATVCATASSRKKKTETDAALLTPAFEKLQPLAADTFSYTMGVAQSASLKTYLEQRENVDSNFMSFVAQALMDAPSLTDAQIKEKQAYAAGLKIAKMNSEQVIPQLNMAATGKSDTTYTDLSLYTKGLADGLKGTSLLSADSAMKVAERQFEYYKQELKERNQAFLVENAKQSDVKTTASGLQYRVITQGTGAMPADTADVEVQYEGKLIDGTVFDSSYKRKKPASFNLSKVIKGWQEGLQLMPEGSVYELYIPYELGYGERGTQNIPAFSTLIFKVELLKVK